MKVTNNNIINLYNDRIRAAQTDRAAMRSSESSAQRQVDGDRVELSQRAREMNDIKEMVEETPDVRLDKVAELKERIQSGNYEVDSKDIAAKIMENSINILS